jgi:hypothetical protein
MNLSVDCDFDRPGNICPRCGSKGWPGLRKNCKNAPRITTPCVHLGPTLRTIQANCCDGRRTRYTIHACPLHRQCNPAKRIPGVKCCAACGDYRAAGVAGAK